MPEKHSVDDFYFIPEVVEGVKFLANSGMTMFLKNDIINLFGKEYGQEFIDKLVKSDFVMESCEGNAIFLRTIGMSFIQMLKTEYAQKEAVEAELCASYGNFLDILAEEMKKTKPDIDAVMNSIDIIGKNENAVNILRKKVEEVFKARNIFIREAVYGK